MIFKRLSALALGMMLQAIPSQTSSEAGVISGSFNGFVSGTLLSVELDDQNRQVFTTIKFTNDPSTCSFRLDQFAPIAFNGNVSIVDNKNGFTAFAESFPFVSSATIVDSIPGRGPDRLSAIVPFLTGTGDTQDVANFDLRDDTGQFIGPNGNGDPSHVFLQARVPLFISDLSKGTATFGDLTFSTQAVPEPSSVMLLGLGALGLFATRFLRLRLRSR